MPHFLLVSTDLPPSSASNFYLLHSTPHHIHIFPSPHTPFSKKKKEKMADENIYDEIEIEVSNFSPIIISHKEKRPPSPLPQRLPPPHN